MSKGFDETLEGVADLALAVGGGEAGGEELQFQARAVGEALYSLLAGHVLAGRAAGEGASAADRAALAVHERTGMGRGSSGLGGGQRPNRLFGAFAGDSAGDLQRACGVLVDAELEAHRGHAADAGGGEERR